MALLGNGVRSATVKAAPDSEAKVIALDRAAFNDLVSDSRLLREELARIIEQRATADQVQLLAAMKQDELAALAARPKRRTGAPGEVVIRAGELGQSFFIIEDGVVDILVQNAAGQEVTVAQLKRGQYFGEMALLGDRRRTATVRVSAVGPARLIEFSAAEFERWAGTSGRRAHIEEEARRRQIDLGLARGGQRPR
jgi:cAMP-dependent protein kinase regulator